MAEFKLQKWHPRPDNAVEVWFDGGLGWLSVIVTDVDSRGFGWTRRAHDQWTHRGHDAGWLTGRCGWASSRWRWGDSRDRLRGEAGKRASKPGPSRER